jgi:hypothetical protein
MTAAASSSASEGTAPSSPRGGVQQHDVSGGETERSVGILLRGVARWTATFERLAPRETRWDAQSNDVQGWD